MRAIFVSVRASSHDASPATAACDLPHPASRASRSKRVTSFDTDPRLCIRAACNYRIVGACPCTQVWLVFKPNADALLRQQLITIDATVSY